jgi:hypothetical protein
MGSRPEVVIEFIQLTYNSSSHTTLWGILSFCHKFIAETEKESFWIVQHCQWGARGSAVVKVLYHKLEGHGFKIR